MIVIFFCMTQARPLPMQGFFCGVRVFFFNQTLALIFYVLSCVSKEGILGQDIRTVSEVHVISRTISAASRRTALFSGRPVGDGELVGSSASLKTVCDQRIANARAIRSLRSSPGA